MRVGPMSAGSLTSIIFRVGTYTYSSACLASTPTVGHLYTEHRKDKEPKSGSGVGLPCGVIVRSNNQSIEAASTDWVQSVTTTVFNLTSSR